MSLDDGNGATKRGAASLLTALALTLLAALCLASPAAAEPLPIRVDTPLTPRRQFGYRPGFQLNIPSFDAANRPVIRSRTASQHVTRSVIRLDDKDAWIATSPLKTVRRAYPRFLRTVNAGGYVSERVEFDTRGRAYTLLEIRMRGGTIRNVLLYSLDGCRTWQLVTLPFGGRPTFYDGYDNGTAALEQYAGWNVGSGPPLVAVWRPVADWPGSRAMRNRLYVIRPAFRGRRLVLPAPTLISTRFVGQCYGAGGASFAASQGCRSFLVWAEVARNGDGGTPVYACTFDCSTRRATRPRFLAAAVRRNDDHVTPGIVRDGKGYLHVLTGAHNAPFRYVHSLNPNDTNAWTPAETVLEGGFAPLDGIGESVAKQTYLSLACLPDNRLVIVYRHGRRGVDSDFDGAYYEALCSQTRSPEGVWSEPQRLVMCADRPGYAIFHQKLTVDRLGRLYLSLSYFSPLDYPKQQRAANRFRHRMVLISRDGGTEWDFAVKADLVEGLHLAASGE